MRLVKHLAVLVCAVLIPVSAFAQASLTGTVRDASGAVLPGVTVEAASPALIQKTETAVTDGTGQYRIIDLRPGTYAVTFTLPGFTIVKREGIELTGTFTATINADLKVGAVSETITVTGETPVVDVQNTRRETVIRADIIASLPATRAYGSLLNVMPGVTVDDNGQALVPTMTFFSAHGGNTNEGRMMINGMTVAAAFNGGGVSSLAYDTTNLDEVQMLVSGGLGESETGGPSMNLVPRSGGNTFAGQAFLNTAGSWSTGNNLDPYLRSVNIQRPPSIINAYDASGALGGPVVRDRVWFYGSYRKYTTATGVEGVNGGNVYAGDGSHWNYKLDPTVEPRNIQGRNIWSARGTAQITPRNRVTFSQEHQARCEGTTLTPSGQGCRTRESSWIGLGSTTSSPEANTGYIDFPYDVTQATWTAPVTSKLLLEAGFSRFAYITGNGPGQVPPDGIFNLIPVTEQSAIDGHNANFVYRGVGSYNNNFANPNSWRASASYVTGSHNLKVGYQGSYLVSDTTAVTDTTELTYRFQKGVPNQFTYKLPNFQTADRTRIAALYAQDTWTHGQLTVQGALRYDQASSFSPAEHNGTTLTSPFNVAPVTLPYTAGAAYKDISPRVGVAYDVFGNGKTALKFNLGRYLAPATNDTNYVANNPANRIVTSVARSWQDTNGNYVVDCNLLNPAQQIVPGGDTCAAITGNALNFGQGGTTSTTVNQDVLHGWGRRPVDWQYGINLQQQLLPRVSLEVGYNRRWWSNFTVTDNQSSAPSDYQKWVINAPMDPRLPGGGGYPIAVYTPTAAAAARAPKNYVTWETDFGPARTQYWHGVDVTVNARPRAGLTLQGGTTTGHAITDTCATIAAIGGSGGFGTTAGNPDPRNCRSVDPIETTLRGLVSYMVPKVDVLVAVTVRSQPALELTGMTGGATYLVPNTVVQSLLGRLPPGGLPGGTTSVSLVDGTVFGIAGNGGPNRLYATNRRNQIDMRFAKVLKFAGRRLDVGVDLQNLLNNNYGTNYESQYDYTAANGGTWLNPTSILSPRFVRVNLTLNF
jgi:hypothetical protein